MQGRGADHAVRESCDRARTGRGTASRRSTSESPPSDEWAGERSGGASARFDGNLGVLQLPSALADAHGRPRGDRFRRQPQGDVASLDQCSVVRRPVSDAVFRFVPGMHSRLHVEIMPLRPSRWPGPRRTLVSAHQRQSPGSWTAVTFTDQFLQEVEVVARRLDRQAIEQTAELLAACAHGAARSSFSE